MENCRPERVSRVPAYFLLSTHVRSSLSPLVPSSVLATEGTEVTEGRNHCGTVRIRFGHLLEHGKEVELEISWP
jgi:hypothetical protein